MAKSFKTRRGAAPVDQWLTVTQAADLLGVAAHTLRDWTAKGVVEASRTAGGHRRYRKADLEHFRAARAEADSLDDVFHRLNELSTLADVSQAVFSALELEELLPLVCQKLVETTGCSGAVVSHYDAEAGDVVTLWEHATGDATWRPGTRYALRDYPATKRVVERQGSYVANLNDPAVEPGERDVLVADGNQSALVLPLVHKGETIGIVECFDRARERSYSQGELALARAICDRIAVAVYNSRLFDRLRRQNDDLELVLDAVKAIASSRDLQEALETIARRLTEAMDVAWCDIYDYDPARQELAVVAYYQIPSVPPSPGWLGTRFTPQEWSDLRRAIEQHETTVLQASDPTLPEPMRAELEKWSEKSTMTVPLLYEGQLVGVLDVAESRWERVFSESDVRLVEAIATQATTVVHNMRLLDETRRRNRELQLLLDTGEVIASSMNLPDALGKVTEWLTHALDVAWADIYEYDPGGDELRVLAFYQIEGVPSAEGWLGTTIPSDFYTYWYRSYHERRPEAIYRDDSDLPAQDAAEMDKWGEKATVAVPLVYRDEVIGLLDVAESRYQRRFSDEETRLVLAIANQLGLAVHNWRLFEATRRRNEELAAALRITETVTSSSDVDSGPADGRQHAARVPRSRVVRDLRLRSRLGHPQPRGSTRTSSRSTSGTGPASTPSTRRPRWPPRSPRSGRSWPTSTTQLCPPTRARTWSAGATRLRCTCPWSTAGTSSASSTAPRFESCGASAPTTCGWRRSWRRRQPRSSRRRGAARASSPIASSSRASTAVSTASSSSPPRCAASSRSTTWWPCSGVSSPRRSSCGSGRSTCTTPRADSFRVSGALGVDRAMSDHYKGLVVPAAVSEGPDRRRHTDLVVLLRRSSRPYLER